jgi:hypothetical protein
VTEGISLETGMGSIGGVEEDGIDDAGVRIFGGFRNRGRSSSLDSKWKMS